MSKKRVSAAEARRRVAEVNEQAGKAILQPADVVEYIANYRSPVATEDEWAVVGPVLKMLLSRSGLQSFESTVKHCTAASAYLLWRCREHLSLAVADAMTFEAVDQFYLRGLGEMTARSKNDYRTRLHGLAGRVNPGLTAPTIVTQGYAVVRPGYTAVDVAAISRVALRLHPPLARRKLCAIVGFCLGGGLDPTELSHLTPSAVQDNGPAGIKVRVPGARARVVMIRRDFEGMVRIGLEGVPPSSPLLGRIKGRSGAVSAAIEKMDLYDCPTVTGSRLRTTWLSWLLTQSVPLNVIMAAAGLKSARTLTDLMAQLPTVDPTELLRDGAAS